MSAEQDILAVYESNVKAVYSINEISKKLGKAYPSVNKSVNSLIEQGILKKTQVGRSYLCSINLENKQTVMHLALNELKKHKTLPDPIRHAAAEIERTHTTACIVYDPTTYELLVITQEVRHPLATRTTTEELTQRLLESKEFFSNHVVIAGHEHFFSILKSPHIERRYHPLL